MLTVILLVVWLVPAVIVMWALDDFPIRVRLTCGLFWFVWLALAGALYVFDVCGDLGE